MEIRTAPRAAALLVVTSMALAGCESAPVTEPMLEPGGRAMYSVTSQVYTSGSQVVTWDPIIPSAAYANWETTVCTTQPLVGPNANWENPHAASVLTGHPWANYYFVAPWINAWNYLASQGPSGHNWTKYQTEVSGDGTFVIRLLADNCSWIYLDGVLVGVQPAGHNASNTSYGLTLNGTHTLEFIIFDGGGAAGGKFLLETTSNPPPPLNDDLDDDGHLNDDDAFPLDPTEWADSDEDGVGDNGDDFPNDPAEQTDSDGDGVGDNSDAYPNDPTRSSLDADEDGLEDGLDNCPAVANADQADLDDDGVGDACDPDIDGDGTPNETDAFPTDAAESADTDGDGIGDNADPFDNSNSGGFLVVGACTTTVANWHLGGGTWANDLIAAAQASASNHGQFVKAVAALADQWKKDGLITGRQQGEIVSCAAKSK